MPESRQEVCSAQERRQASERMGFEKLSYDWQSIGITPRGCMQALLPLTDV